MKHYPLTGERLLRLPAVLAKTGRARACLYKDIAAGTFPRPVTLGRVSAWAESEVQLWIEERKAARNRA